MDFAASQTVYRRDTSVMGRISAFKGTDPEFLLAVECDLKSPDRSWQVRPMWFSTQKLDLRRNGNIVWSVPKYNETNESAKLTDPYMIVTLVETTTSKFNAIREQAINELNQ